MDVVAGEQDAPGSLHAVSEQRVVDRVGHGGRAGQVVQGAFVAPAARAGQRLVQPLVHRGRDLLNSCPGDQELPFVAQHHRRTGGAFRVGEGRQCR